MGQKGRDVTTKYATGIIANYYYLYMLEATADRHST
jgi:hypothetical protein